MLKLLCVLDGMSCPPRSGGDQAVFNALRLIQYHVDLHLFVITDGIPDIDMGMFKELLPKVEVEFYNVKCRNTYENIHASIKKIRNSLMSIFRLSKEQKAREGIIDVEYERYARMYAAINSYISMHGIDIVQFEFARPLYWTEAIVGNVKKVFIQHEIQYIVKEQRMSHNNVSELERLRVGVEKNREIAAMSACDAIITLSEDDREKLLRDGIKAPVFSSFAKVQLREAEFVDYTTLDCVNLVFVGPEQHEPNRHGMQWFVKNVWNRLLIRHPSLQLHIIGKWSEMTKTDWSANYKNLIFDGFVEDLTKAMQRNILIVPIFEGSGIRMKILEAANVGVPFVGTTIGAEGLGFENGKNCVIANDADSFYIGITSILEDFDLANKYALEAYKHAKEDFADERFVETRMRAYNYLAQKSI